MTTGLAAVRIDKVLRVRESTPNRFGMLAIREAFDACGDWSDAVRAYLMFFARWDLGGPWDSQGIEGSARWLRREGRRHEAA